MAKIKSTRWKENVSINQPNLIWCKREKIKIDLIKLFVNNFPVVSLEDYCFWKEKLKLFYFFVLNLFPQLS